jgi:hypothetical protein
VMSIEEIIEAGDLVPKQYRDSLYADLKNPTFGWLLCDPNRDQERLQGDILEEVPGAFINEEGDARIRRGTALVLNNTCDLQPERSYLTNFAVVTNFENYASTMMQEEGERAKDHIQSLQANKLSEIFYIPHCSQLPSAGVVRLDSLFSIPQSNYERLIAHGKRRATLTRNGYYYFLSKVANFLLRRESEEVERYSVPI